MAVAPLPSMARSSGKMACSSPKIFRIESINWGLRGVHWLDRKRFARRNDPTLQAAGRELAKIRSLREPSPILVRCSGHDDQYPHWRSVVCRR